MIIIVNPLLPTMNHHFLFYNPLPLSMNLNHHQMQISFMANESFYDLLRLVILVCSHFLNLFYSSIQNLFDATS